MTDIYQPQEIALKIRNGKKASLDSAIKDLDNKSENNHNKRNLIGKVKRMALAAISLAVMTYAGFKGYQDYKGIKDKNDDLKHIMKISETYVSGGELVKYAKAYLYTMELTMGDFYLGGRTGLEKDKKYQEAWDNMRMEYSIVKSFLKENEKKLTGEK